MKIPSIKLLINEAIDSARRFPLTILSALIGVCIAVYLVEYEDEFEDLLPLFNLLLVSGLGLVLFFSIKVYKDKVGDSKLPFWLLNIIGTGVLALIYFSLPQSIGTSSSQPYIRYTIYNGVMHLLVSFAPFIGKGEINGFWQYNKMLFLRICLSLLYSGFVYVGLALAMISLNLLFDADIEGETFFQLFIIVLGLFNTWFFVSGVDKDLKSLNGQTDYPKGLKTFAQYVLLPLLILYLLILYAYVVKIVGLWDWPEGVVSYLIVCVAVLGILTFLLIYPFGKSDVKHWIAKFSSVYYYTLLPLTVVLFMAIGIRIGDYGLTVNRYILVELGVWLGFVSLHFILGKKNIKIIPMSLAGLVLLTSFGPWGMFTMSERSQVNRLKSILEVNGILKNGVIVNEPKLNVEGTNYFINKNNIQKVALSDSLQNEVYSIVNYLDDYHGFDRIDDWFRQKPDSLLLEMADSGSTYQNGPRMRMELMGLEYRYNYNYSSIDRGIRTYQIENFIRNVEKVAGYDYLLKVNYFGEDDFIQEYMMDSVKVVITKKSPTEFHLLVNKSDPIVFDFKQLIDQLDEKYDGETTSVTDRELEMEGANQEGMTAKIRLNEIRFEDENKLELNSYSGSVLINLSND